MRIAGWLVLALWASGVAAQEPSLAQLLRHGVNYIGIGSEYTPADLPQLIAGSDLIARVVVKSAKSYEIQTFPRIMTDHTVDLFDILHQRGRSYHKSGDLLTVRRRGGQLLLDRKVIEAREQSFPAFEVGDEYVLMLRREPRTDVFVVVGGGQGAFRIGPDWVARQVRHIEGDTPEERPRQDLPVHDLRSLIITLATRP
jgi:hypothetical protein